MTTKKSIEKVCGCDAPAKFDFVFMHGLTGDMIQTWLFENDSGNQFWPKWLCEDFADTAVYTLGYESSFFGKWAKKELNIHERAESILEDLASSGIGKRPLAFVTHSLGGLLAKEVLRVSNECQDADWKAVGNSTKLVAFLGTPHTGASLAGAIKAFVPRISSTHIETLSNDDGYLTSLNKAYRDVAKARHIQTVAYFEKHKTKNAAIVVAQESADPGVDGCRPLAVEADHIGICKLPARDNIVYRSLSRHLTPIVNAAIHGDTAHALFGPQDYATATAADRRDLLQKLIDAGREHEYSHANELQTTFAKDYYRLGLHTEAKNQNDAILAEVEQRFVTHVYHAKICKKASDEEIAKALQDQVIQPICAQKPGVISQTAVLQALYFLTERCHIRWDCP